MVTRSTLVPAAALFFFPAVALSQQVIDLPARDRALPVTAPTLATIGKFDGADWEVFGDIAGVQFDGAGNLYVFDRQKSRVVVVDPAGKFVRMFGKQGDGPGELRAPAAMVVLPDGTTVLADMGHRAFMMFDPKGEFQRSVPMGGDEGLTVLGELFSDGKGGLISAGQATVMMTRQVGPGGPGGPLAPPPGEPVVRFSLEGRGGQKLLLRAWQPPRPEQKPTRIEAGGGAMVFRGPESVAFEPKLLSGILPDGGLAYTDSSAYAIKITGPDGAVRRVLKRPLEPRGMTRAIQDAEKERRLAELEEGGGPQMRMMIGGPNGAPQQVSPEQIKQMRRGQIEQMQFYPEVPVVTDVATGWSGKIWVQRRGQDVYAPGPIDVLAATGEYLGTIDPKSLGLPRAFGPDGRVAFVVRDDLDIPRVVVRQLPTDLR